MEIKILGLPETIFSNSEGDFVVTLSARTLNKDEFRIQSYFLVLILHILMN